MHLSWEKVAEAKQYTLEKRINNIHFETLAVFSAANNSLFYNDKNAVNGNNFYRLRVQDIAGNWAYSSVESAYFEGIEPSIQFYDNTLTIKILQSPVFFKLIDVNGKILDSRILYQQAEIIDLSKYAAGLYFCYLYDGKGLYVHKVVK